MNCDLCACNDSLFKCSLCSILVCDRSCSEWRRHRTLCATRHSVLGILNDGKLSQRKVRTAINLLSDYFDCGFVGLEFENGCTHVAKANERRIHICFESLSCEFQDDSSHVIPDYKDTYGVNHFTVVLLHEFGHVLDKRDKFPSVLKTKKYKDSEERATEFALYFLNGQTSGKE